MSTQAERAYAAAVLRGQADARRARMPITTTAYVNAADLDRVADELDEMPRALLGELDAADLAAAIRSLDEQASFYRSFSLLPEYSGHGERLDRVAAALRQYVLDRDNAPASTPAPRMCHECLADLPPGDSPCPYCKDE